MKPWLRKWKKERTYKRFITFPFPLFQSVQYLGFRIELFVRRYDL